MSRRSGRGGRSTGESGTPRSGPPAPGPGRLALAVIALIALSTGSGCGNGEPMVLITSPANGTITTDASVQVQGILLDILEDSVADVLVNGVSALPLGPAQTFSVSVPLDPVAVLNPIVVEVVGQSGGVLRERVMVISGDSVADGDFSPEGIALRLTETGLDALEPLVTSLVPLDLASLVPPGTLVVDNYCYQDSIFGCLGRIDATISGSPPPSLSSFSLDIDPLSGFVAGDITLYDLFFRADVVAVTGIGFSCTVDVTAATALILGDFDLAPMASQPSDVDVVQIGPVSVSFGSFNDSTNCAGFLGGVVEFFIDVFISDLQNDLVRPGLENFLNTVDASGNTPIAAAIEQALEAIEIAGPIGAALGIDLETPLFTVDEDTGGITFGSDARITATLPDPEAVDLTASYHVSQPFPVFGPTSPSGSPYDLAVGVSASAFNQLLKAEIESGLLITTVTEFDLGQGLQPITAGALAAILPNFALLDPSELLQFDIRPATAPIMTGEPGPAGELATVRIGQLSLSLAPVADPTVTLLRGSVDVVLGLDTTHTLGELTFVLSPATAADIDVTLLENPLFIDEALLDPLLPVLVQLAVPALADSLGTFPLPDFLGLELGLVDVDRNGEHTSLFFDLAPAP